MDGAEKPPSNRPDPLTGNPQTPKKTVTTGDGAPASGPQLPGAHRKDCRIISGGLFYYLVKAS